MSKILSRRTVLRGAGGIAIALPALQIMGTPKQARGAYGDAAQRLLVVYTPHGRREAANDKWRPSGTGAGFELSEFMSGFEGLRDDMIVLSGLDVKTAMNQSGNPHSKGATHALTASRHLAEANEGDTSSGPIGYASSISFDQRIANGIAETTELKFPSLQFGVQTGAQFSTLGATTRNYLSYAGSGDPLPAEEVPSAMFDRLFSDFDVDAGELDRIRAERRSVLDLVRADFEKLNPTLGAEDKSRLDEHLEHIRAIEQSIDITATDVSPLCGLPDIGAAVEDPYDNQNFAEVGRQQEELLRMALACDLTRVASMQWSTAQSSTRLNWVDGVSGTHHGITHDGTLGADYDSITQWYADRVAAFVTEYAAIPDVDGNSMLDSTVVLWVGGEVSFADTHQFADMPYVVFGGGAGGVLQGGQHLDFGGRSNGDLFLTLIQAMGFADTTFGDPEYLTGPLAGVLA